MTIGFRSALLLVLLNPLLVRAADNESGTIHGTLRLIGRAPAIPQIEPAHDSEACGTRPRSAYSLTLGTNQTVSGSIVYLVGMPRKVERIPPVVLETRDCEFVPRVQIAQSGATLTIRNSDPTLHVVRLVALNGTNAPVTLIATAAPYAGFEKTFQLANVTQPAFLKASSGDGHPWMTGYIVVTPHPWAALSDENGAFTIRGVPPGTHKLYAWHEALGTLAREVQVIAGRSSVVNLEFKPAPPK